MKDWVKTIERGGVEEVADRCRLAVCKAKVGEVVRRRVRFEVWGPVMEQVVLRARDGVGGHIRSGGL